MRCFSLNYCPILRSHEHSVHVGIPSLKNRRKISDLKEFNLLLGNFDVLEKSDIAHLYAHVQLLLLWLFHGRMVDLCAHIGYVLLYELESRNCWRLLKIISIIWLWNLFWTVCVVPTVQNWQRESWRRASLWSTHSDVVRRTEEIGTSTWRRAVLLPAVQLFPPHRGDSVGELTDGNRQRRLNICTQLLAWYFDTVGKKWVPYISKTSKLAWCEGYEYPEPFAKRKNHEKDVMLISGGEFMESIISNCNLTQCALTSWRRLLRKFWNSHWKFCGTTRTARDWSQANTSFSDLFIIIWKETLRLLWPAPKWPWGFSAFKSSEFNAKGIPGVVEFWPKADRSRR